MTFPWWVIGIAFVVGFLIGVFGLYYTVKTKTKDWWKPQ